MKAREIKGLTKKEREKRLKELKIELSKSRANASKGGSSKIKQIKKIIARIHTINNSEKLSARDKSQSASLSAQLGKPEKLNKK